MLFVVIIALVSHAIKNMDPYKPKCYSYKKAVGEVFA